VGSSDKEHDGLGTEDALRRIEAAEERHVVEQALVAARERLGMDAAYITTIGAEAQTIERVVDNTDVFGQFEGTTSPLEETYCLRMLRGDMPNVVPDTRAEPAVRDLEATRVVAAYAGVPVRLPDGRLHGTICCVSAAPVDGLGAEELRFMQVLADIVSQRLARAEGNLSRLLARTGEG
jgi:GAF domain-containing protein